MSCCPCCHAHKNEACPWDNPFGPMNLRFVPPFLLGKEIAKLCCCKKNAHYNGAQDNDIMLYCNADKWYYAVLQC